MANNFIKFKGNKVGKSLVEIDSEKNVKEILNKAEKNNCKIILPSDFAVSNSTDEGEASFKELKNIKDNEMILDIGPQTIEKIGKIIDLSKTVLWNGPAGLF